MDLLEIYEAEGMRGLRKLAYLADTDANYLYQCATNWRGRIPSPRIVAKLIEADPRISFDDVYKALLEDEKTENNPTLG